MSPWVNANPSVAIVNDHEWSARAVGSVLDGAGFGVSRYFTAASFLDALPGLCPDAVILDVQLPDTNGMRLSGILRRHPQVGAAVPIILTTAGPSGRTERLAAYEAGAWDFFGQPLDADTLIAKLGIYVAAKREVIAEARAEYHGLYTPSELLRRSGELGAMARRRGAPLACLRVASVPAGDGEPSRVLGDTVRRLARREDLIGRSASGAVLVVAYDTDHDAAHLLGERLVEATAQGGEKACTVTVTVSSPTAADAVSAESLVATALAA